MPKPAISGRRHASSTNAPQATYAGMAALRLAMPPYCEEARWGGGAAGRRRGGATARRDDSGLVPVRTDATPGGSSE
ncbi:MAG TPA: hypothetical protein PKK06_09555 [Phycisphaerae bacterium]|nr:hypothetical protein [Phycisphaerae bacterium]HNU45545.1 hypothetical protein [Phycisphaerae bacterium]